MAELISKVHSFEGITISLERKSMRINLTPGGHPLGEKQSTPAHHSKHTHTYSHTHTHTHTHTDRAQTDMRVTHKTTISGRSAPAQLLRLQVFFRCEKQHRNHVRPRVN